MTTAHVRPRVLMVVGAYFPELAGGSLQCRTLIGALRDRVDFSVFTTTADRSLPGAAEIEGVRVDRVFVDVKHPATKLTATAAMLGRLPALTASHDIFHFHGFTEKMLPLVAAAKLARRPTIEKMTSLGWDDPVSIERRPHGWWLRAAMRRVDRFVAINPAMRDRCRDAGIPDAQVRTIPNGVDTTRFSPVDAARRREVRARLGLPASATVVAFVGFWSREKGPHLLFDAWTRARRATDHPTVLLYIGSTNAAHAEVDATLVQQVRDHVTRDGLEPWVRFVEQTPAVESYLQASDIFVLPSAREGLSNALLEAMAVGLPPIVTAIPGATDAVIEEGVTGWTVPPGDRDALAARLQQLFLRPDCGAQVGRAARASVVERFSITAVADAYYDLYRTVIAPLG
ncbi:MAG TPA: glycosyltransferase family 4 protein [Vicinamibacterales bacterium]|nr:glycosyltransferase family 4 protein [Vicinamibacterales bacterium]